MKFFAVSSLLLSILAIGSCSPVSTKAKYSTEICTYERLVNDAACHCFIASESKLIPTSMHQMCTDGFGQDLHRLGAACTPYVSKDGAFNHNHYSRMLDLSVKTCFRNGDPSTMKLPHPSAHQYLPTPTLSTSFTSQGGSGSFRGGSGGFTLPPSNNLNIPGITNPINVGGIGFTWKPTYSNNRFGVDVTGSRGGTSLTYSYPSQTYTGKVPIPGKLPGSFSVTYNPKTDFIGAGVTIPF